jgi:hypothetical protein
MHNEAPKRTRNPRFIVKPRIVQNGVTLAKFPVEDQEKSRAEQTMCQGGVCFLRWKPSKQSA